MNTPTLPEIGIAQVIRADARDLPLDDNTVDLVVTSPPYFALRSYQDGGEHYAGQIGDEPTPAEFVESLLEVTRECVRVLKPTGSLWVNLGDKYAGGGGQWEKDLRNRPLNGAATASRNVPTRGRTYGARPKSLLGIPWRYALACIDELGLILRAEVVWSKPNGLPESVTDRVRRSHEQWLHFTIEPRYYSATDEIREPHVATVTGRDTSAWRTGPSGQNRATSTGRRHDDGGRVADFATSPLGKLPGSVWTIPTEPLRIPEHVAHARCCSGGPRPGCEDGVDHFAAFPTEWPRRIIQGWSPPGICTACGEGRRPVAEVLSFGAPVARAHRHLPGMTDPAGVGRRDVVRGIAGETCACPEPTAPTRPAVVLDPFGGTGTTATVAKALGRHGITVDKSADYCRIAEWRTTDRDQLAKVLRIAKAEQQPAEQEALW